MQEKRARCRGATGLTDGKSFLLTPQLLTPSLLKNLYFPCDILHLVIREDGVRPCVYLLQFGVELYVGGVEHVGDDGKLGKIAVVYHPIVLRCQLYALLPCAQIDERLAVKSICFLHFVIEHFGRYGVAVTAPLHLGTRPANGLVALEQRTERVSYAYAYSPDVEVLVNGRDVIGERTTEVFCRE